MSVVLITGVSRFLGSRLAAQLAADPGIERVIGIDTVLPRTIDLPQLGRMEFVRADIRNPLIAKVMAQARVTTVVHTALMASGRTGGGRASMQEMNVIGTMQLLAASQKSETVERVVVKSTTAVYGCGPADPAVFTEDMHPHAGAQAGYAKDAVEVEGYVRGFARRRPDLAITVLRLANVLGPTVDTALARYLAMPVIPSALGFDPRLQVLHEADAVEALRLATVAPHPGIFNVAGEGAVTLSQIVRRARRLRIPVPAPALSLAGTLVRNSGLLDVTAEESRFLNFGRVVDTTRLREEFGYSPRLSTSDTVSELLAGGRPLPKLALAGIGVGSRVLQARRDRHRLAVSGA